MISAILPVKNRAHHLPELLRRIRAQECDAAVEIIAVDSESTDRSVDVLQGFGCTVVSVEGRTFDYGATRNAAVAFARGELLLFISSTMLPLDRHWLQPLLDRMREPGELAGVYSRGIPSPNSSVLNARDYLRADLLTNRRHFAEITRDRDPMVRRIADRAAYERLSATDLRQFISFSNVSSLVRASVFRMHPFARVDACGEDMLWARDVLEAGFAIRYEPRSVVIYSHDYNDDDLFRRSFDDARGNRVIAGVCFGGEALVPTIQSIILDDWRYIRRSHADREAELEAGLRRVYQVVGQWLGANWSDFGDRIEDLVAHLSSLHTTDATANDLIRRFTEAALSSATRSDERFHGAMTEAVRAAWGSLGREATDDARIEVMLAAAAEIAGRWVAGNAAGFSSGIRARFSLIESIRRGHRTGDMSPVTISAVNGNPRPAAVPSSESWTADLDALRAVLDAHEREYFCAHEELENRALEMSKQNSEISALHRLMDETVAQRDAQIRSLQAELHEKIAIRDRMIGDLQQEMQTKVLECNRIIEDLQRQIADHR